jgi:hypothetical protein
LTVGGDAGGYAWGAGTVGDEDIEVVPVLAVRLVGQDDLGALEAGEVPAFGGGGGGQGVRRGCLRGGGVGDVAHPGVDEGAVDLVGEDAAVVAVDDVG